MDLSAIGYEAKQFRVIPKTVGNLVTDFIQGKFQVIGVECNARGAYGSPVQKSLARRFPDMAAEVGKIDYEAAKVLGTTVLQPVQTQHRRRLFVANMFISTGFGLGQNDGSSRRPVNRFSEHRLESAFDSLLEQCDKLNVSLDRQIAVQRMYGGLGGVPWSEVCLVLDRICEKHKFNMYAYLPKNFDTNFVRGIAQ
jgi:hypothetical protein